MECNVAREMERGRGGGEEGGKERGRGGETEGRAMEEGGNAERN